MPDFPADHAGLEVLPLTECLRLLASVPVGRIAFHADGEVVVLPVNHLVDGQGIVFRTASGSKLSAAEKADIVAFEADDYDAQAKSGWSVVVNGQAEILYENTETQRLSGLGLHPWATAVDRPFWIRIRPTSVSGRQIPKYSSG
jgi:nitroimidazol reductase NimA-like FMN-containing flavoprotein (pyridoxamine 5'-phosphate oxidase superfamily)